MNDRTGSEIDRYIWGGIAELASRG